MIFQRKLEDGTIEQTVDTKGMTFDEVLEKYKAFPCSEVKKVTMKFNESVSRTIPAITLTHLGYTLTVGFDTGCDVNIITSELMEHWQPELKANEKDVNGSKTTMTLSGKDESPFGKTADMEIVDLENNIYLFDRYYTNSAWDTGHKTAAYAYDILLGQPFMRRRGAVIDFMKNEVSFYCQSVKGFEKDMRKKEAELYPVERFRPQSQLGGKSVRELRIIFDEDDKAEENDGGAREDNA